MDYKPGIYFIELYGEDPILVDHKGQPLKNPKFVAKKNASEFTFQIRNPDLGFGPQALQWIDKEVAVPQPESIRSTLQGGTLTLTVSLPNVLVSDVEFDFTLLFNNGKKIEALTAHGRLQPVDPTIVEKAVEPPHHPSGDAR